MIHNLLRYVVYSVVAFFSFSSAFASGKQAAEGEIDVKEIVLGHLGDAYEWHFFATENVEGTIPLPCIVRDEETHEWKVFMSSKIHEAMEHGEANYQGFYFNEERNGKIYQQLSDGTSVRPLDFSITKNVSQILLTSLILIVVFLGCARWAKGHNSKEDAPGGFVGMMEALVMYLVNDLIKPCVGEKHYRPFVPYLLTVFFFILVSNLLGLVPGGANVTGNINITFFLAFCTMLAVNLSGNKEYWKEIFWPDVPVMLKFYPIAIMPVIEMFGIISKPFALMVRLFANMMAGHAIILSFLAIIFVTCAMGGWMSYVVGGGMTIMSFVMILYMNFLECLVAFVQAYVFTLLSAVFIGLSHPVHEHKA